MIDNLVTAAGLACFLFGLFVFFSAVLGLFRHKFTLYGFTISYWDVLIWSLVAGIVISFIKGLLTGDE